MTDQVLEGEEFSSRIAPVLDRFETRRKECIRKWGIGSLVVVVLAVTVSAWALTSGSMGGGGLIFVLIAAGLLSFGMLHLFTDSYKKSYKREVVNSVVSAFHEGLRYDPSACVSERQFRESELFKKGIDRYRGEDYIAGSMGKTEFEFSELHAEYKTTSTDSKGRRSTSWHTIFKGVFFIADFHKDFRTRTVVLPDTAERIFGFLGQKLQGMNFLRGELVKLENPEFEREFCVYGEDQVEARYLLSPALMERILAYKRKFGSAMHVAFFNSKVYVALSSGKNRFEPKLFSPANDMSLIDDYRSDLELITGIVEDLNLNVRLWSKE